MKFVLETDPWTDPSEVITLEGSREEQLRRSVPRVPEADPQARERERAAVLDQLRPFVGKQVEIQAWDPIMVILDEEGPFLISGSIEELVIPDASASTPPHFRLAGARSFPAEDGYDLLPLLDREGDCFLFPVSCLYWIETLTDVDH